MRRANLDPSAVYREIVHGDLKAAAAQYRAILGQSNVPRTVAARALYQLGQCLEKSGRLSEARESYTRLLREYGDQSAMASLARVRLRGCGRLDPRSVELEIR